MFHFCRYISAIGIQNVLEDGTPLALPDGSTSPGWLVACIDATKQNLKRKHRKLFFMLEQFRYPVVWLKKFGSILYHKFIRRPQNAQIHPQFRKSKSVIKLIIKQEYLNLIRK